jgi:murein DD-endopeptidase MepM/ murein hydrolase activator NlpD
MLLKKYLVMATIILAIFAPIEMLTATISNIIDIYTNMRAPIDNPAAVQTVSTAKRQPVTTPEKYGFPFSSPTNDPSYLTRDFGIKQDNHGQWVLSSGVKLAALEGSPVFSTHDGTVVSVGRKGGYGLQVEVKNELGVKTRHSHLGSSIVNEGQVVRQGEQIGLVGKTGMAKFPQLGYQVLIADHPVDPMAFFQLQRANSQKHIRMTTVKVH